MDLKDIPIKMDNPYYEEEAKKALDEYRATGFSQTVSGIGLYEQIEAAQKVKYDPLTSGTITTTGWATGTASTITYGGYDSIDSKQSEINDLKERVAQLEKSVALLLARKIINE